MISLATYIALPLVATKTLTSEDEFESLEGEGRASEIFRASKRMGYVVDKWVTPLYLDLRQHKITIGIGPGHIVRMIRALRDCELKLLTLKYHLDNMVRLNNEFATEDRRILELTNATEQKSISIPLDFELEAFLLQARACLEVFCQVLASRFQLSRIKPSNIKRVLLGRPENFAAKVSDNIVSHPFSWRVVQGESETTLRDWAAHYGRIALTSLESKVVEKGIAYRGPSLRDEVPFRRSPLLSENIPIPATVFAGALMHDLEHLVKDSLGMAFDRPPPGEKEFLVSDPDVWRL